MVSFSRKGLFVGVVSSLFLGVFSVPLAGAVSNPLYPEPGDKVADASVYISVSKGFLMSEGSMCSGSLIHPEWVITNAHCFGVGDEHVNGGDLPNIGLSSEAFGSSTSSVFDGFYSSKGNSFLSSVLPNLGHDTGVFVGVGDNLFGAEYRDIVEIHAEPNGYGNKSHNKDIALLKLNEPVTSVEPIELSEEELDRYRKIDTITYGWSMRSVLSPKVRYRLGETYQKNGRVYTEPKDPKSVSEPGDSGGPIVDENGRLVAVHARSFNGTYTTGVPIYDSLDWIKDTIENE